MKNSVNIHDQNNPVNPYNTKENKDLLVKYFVDSKVRTNNLMKELVEAGDYQSLYDNYKAYCSKSYHIIEIESDELVDCIKQFNDILFNKKPNQFEFKLEDVYDGDFSDGKHTAISYIEIKPLNEGLLISEAIGVGNKFFNYIVRNAINSDGYKKAIKIIDSMKEN